MASSSGFFPSSGGVKLYYEETGEGIPLVFCHEFAGDLRSWEPQVRYFSHRFRVITYNARGYSPSDVPTDGAQYSLDIAISDVVALLDHLKIERAHVVGFSMGSFTSLFFGMRHPDRARSVTPVCCGYGAEKGWDEIHKRNFNAFADELLDDAKADEASDRYSNGATRVQYLLKDPRGWAEFAEQFRNLSRTGRALTLRHVVAARPSVLDFAEEFRRMTVPVLLLTGDEDEQTLMPGVFMKKHIPTCGFCVLPRIGHTINLEEPGLFNLMLNDFLSAVEIGKWQARDPRTMETAKYLAPREGEQ